MAKVTKKISSLKNEYVKHLVKIRKDKDYRNEQRRVLIVGRKMVDEIRTIPESLILLKGAEPPEHLAQVNKTEVSADTLQKITGLKNPDGIAAEMAMPEEISFDGFNHIIALDAVKDPGNLGTLIRTALAFSYDGVYILETSCDPFNDKALRAAKGATFRIPIKKGSWAELKTLIQKNEWTPYGADMNGRAVKSAIKLKKPLLIFGGEGEGLSREARRISTLISIPMHKEMESLNVSIAGGILMYLMKKK